MRVDELEIVPVKPNQGHVGFCSLVIEGSLYLAGIAIYTRPQGGYRLVYPTKRTAGTERPVFYPITKELGRQLEEKVGDAFENVMKNHAGHTCTNI